MDERFATNNPSGCLRPGFFLGATNQLMWSPDDLTCPSFSAADRHAVPFPNKGWIPGKNFLRNDANSIRGILARRWSSMRVFTKQTLKQIGSLNFTKAWL
jgi:hypothetical protein